MKQIPVEAQIHLNKFQPRPYQLPILDAIENKGYKRVIAIMPRRAGKDVMAFNLCIRQCLKRVCVIYYIFPTYSQGRKALFDSIMTNGMRFLDFIPKELIESINSQEMKIRFINGSIFQVVGSDNIDSLMGTNPQGVVFSEYALQDPRAYQFIRPILAANAGWALFITTPSWQKSCLRAIPSS
jgi:phage terminase large subunit